ncbi:hypothetical protein B0T17DRAFT_508004 [Bombardia bombarda]|uniref:Uncharacterized protein n=1 Tax=Bombardia bombarda TaxID=252184 RepID=A0AA39X0F9_9PEZI|nr:hypothetical protein B0T17DRAFT_508004 [Bombardia bombarda]
MNNYNSNAKMGAHDNDTNINNHHENNSSVAQRNDLLPKDRMMFSQILMEVRGDTVHLLSNIATKLVTKQEFQEFQSQVARESQAREQAAQNSYRLAMSMNSGINKTHGEITKVSAVTNPDSTKHFCTALIGVLCALIVAILVGGFCPK